MIIRVLTIQDGVVRFLIIPLILLTGAIAIPMMISDIRAWFAECYPIPAANRKKAKKKGTTSAKIPVPFIPLNQRPVITGRRSINF